MLRGHEVVSGLAGESGRVSRTGDGERENSERLPILFVLPCPTFFLYPAVLVFLLSSNKNPLPPPYPLFPCNAGVQFNALNVLDPELQHIREGIKEYSDWPTIPQLYVNGEFVGGCDIVTDMHKSGELAELFTEAGAKKAEE